MKHIKKFFESSDTRDMTDKSDSWITRSADNYKRIQESYKIDKEDIRNIFQDVLDLYDNLVIDCLFYHNRRGFTIYFYDTQHNIGPSGRSFELHYKIDEDIIEEINSRLSDFGLKSRLVYDESCRYFNFDISIIPKHLRT